MDLHLTWDGLTGPDINYLVQYRPYGSTDLFTTSIQNLHDNFHTISGLPDGFYEIKVSHMCTEYTVSVTWPKAGKPSCDIPKFVSYQILSDNSIEQVVKINITNNNIQIKAKVTNLSDNILFREEVVTSNESYTVTLPKSATQPNTFKIEIANICLEGESDFVDMGEYSVQQVSTAVTINLENLCECIDYTSNNIKFTNSITNQVYINPYTIPRGKYNIEWTVNKGTCNVPIKVFLSRYSGQLLLSKVDQDFTSNTVSYIVLFPNVDLNIGAQLGSYVTNIDLSITC